MKIVFVLPFRDKKPIGGYKIVYEYANRLLGRGHEVIIAYCSEYDMIRTRLPLAVRTYLSSILAKYNPKWFNLDKKVVKMTIPKIEDRYMPDADIVFATAIGTVESIEKLDGTKGKKFYLVQDYETWNRTDEEVCRTYRYEDMQKVLIASWLREYMENQSHVDVIPNPINTKEFFVKNSIEDRNPYTIAVLYHTAKHKGLQYALKVLEILKDKYPILSVKMFGTYKRPKKFPKWIVYKQNAQSSDLLDIYNSCAIFLCASVEEGFGLTGAEAMACGCALVSSNYRGVREYAVHMENSLLSPVKDIDAMVENVEKLFDNDSLRIQIAKNGSMSIQKNSWKNAVDKMEELFRRDINKG